MGYGCKDATQGPGSYRYRAIEVVLVKRSGMAATGASGAVLTVDNSWETLNFVQDNMGEIAVNLVRVKQMNLERGTHVEESAKLFEKTLGPFFTLISATAREHVMDKLSDSLRKALLLMAMDRYSCDSDRICRALGISKGKLEKELKRCGLPHHERKAA